MPSTIWHWAGCIGISSESKKEIEIEIKKRFSGIMNFSLYLLTQISI